MNALQVIARRIGLEKNLCPKFSSFGKLGWPQVDWDPFIERLVSEYNFTNPEYFKDKGSRFLDIYVLVSALRIGEKLGIVSRLWNSDFAFNAEHHQTDHKFDDFKQLATLFRSSEWEYYQIKTRDLREIFFFAKPGFSEKLFEQKAISELVESELNLLMVKA